MWRQLAVGSAVVSVIGMIVLAGMWPAFDRVASLAVNVTVLVTQIVMRWPPQAMLGR
ncbi:MAG: hypothetical protein KGJ98_13910 [Chloroflexota bacterium]|nr:hypothetical protein [Chloroflexota bacterium]